MKSRNTKTERLLRKIERIRRENNRNWMQVLRIAFAEAPEETREVMKRITDCDSKISELTRQLGEQNGKPGTTPSKV